jgi:hypothetical protein
MLQPGFGTRMIGKDEAPSPAYMWGEAEIGWIRRLVDDPSAHETQAMASYMPGKKAKRAETAEAKEESGLSGGGAPASPADDAREESEMTAAGEAGGSAPARGRAKESAAPAAAAPASSPVIAPAQKAISKDQDTSGELRVIAKEPSTIKLAEFDVAAENLQNTMLVYFVEVKALDLSAPAYLEILVHLQGEKDEWIDAHEPGNWLTKAGDWQKFAVPYLLRSGQIPDKIVLNLVFDGKGSVLMRNLRLER